MKTQKHLNTLVHRFLFPLVLYKIVAAFLPTFFFSLINSYNYLLVLSSFFFFFLMSLRKIAFFFF